jgi:4'-phosphopantetheinyl transferase
MIELWTWSLDADVLGQVDPAAVLSDDEIERASHFVRPRDASRYVNGRARLRAIVGEYLGQAPHEVAFSYNPFGKPELASKGQAPFHFNLSHSAGQALLAVSDRFALGVDIEEIRPMTENVAGHFFSPAECRELRALPGAEQMPAFYRCWTRKEAFVKAHGAGLSLALDCFDVSLAIDPQPILKRLDPSVGKADDWGLFNIEVGDGFCAALAAMTFGQEVRIHYRGEWREHPNITSIT